MTNSILVVIPTYNEATTIEQVITSLIVDLQTTAGPITFVVADGGSTDGTQNIVEKLSQTRPDLFLLHNPKKLQSAAINLAARQFGKNADILIRCDAHALYPPNFIDALVGTLNKIGADSIVVAMDSIGNNCLQKAIAWVSDTIIGSGGSAHRGGRQSGFVDHGHHAAFRMSTFRKVGGYDETFSHNEDAEFDCRQRALDAKIYLNADIRLGYYPRSKLSGLWRQYFGYGKGRSRTVRRHPTSLRLRQLAVPVHLGFSVTALALGYWLPLLLAWPVCYLLVLSIISIKLARQHRSPCGLLAAPCAFVMHTAWALGFYWGWLSVQESTWNIDNTVPLMHTQSHE